MKWQANLLTASKDIDAVIADARRIAVLGMEDENHDGKAAFYIPEYLRTHGFEVVPVPLKYPDAKEVAGQRAYPRLTEVPGEIDIVDVFLNARRIDEQLAELLDKHPKTVWFQQGIRNDHAAEQLARAGIQVVQDKCIMKAHMAYQARAAHRSSP